MNAELDDLVGDDDKRRDLKKKRKRLKKDLQEAQTELLLLQLEASQKGFVIP